MRAPFTGVRDNLLTVTEVVKWNFANKWVSNCGKEKAFQAGSVTDQETKVETKRHLFQALEKTEYNQDWGGKGVIPTEKEIERGLGAFPFCLRKLKLETLSSGLLSKGVMIIGLNLFHFSFRAKVTKHFHKWQDNTSLDIKICLPYKYPAVMKAAKPHGI